MRLKPVHFALLIVILGAVLRFQHLGAIEHNVDHAYPIWQAMMTLQRGYFPLTAQGTSVLFANPALTGYLFIPFVAATQSPVGAYVFVILLNTLAIWLTYRAAALLLDEPRAVIAALLIAINPWVIEYSRTTWVQALLPFFATLIFWLLVPVLLGKSRHPQRRTILALVAMTAMTQTYLLGFAILAPISVLLLVFRRRVSWKAVGIGIVIFGAATALYAGGLWTQRDETLDRITSFSSGVSHLSAEAWTHAVRLVSGQNYAVARGVNAPINDWVLREHASEVVHYALMLCLIAGIAITLYGLVRRDPSANRDLIAVIWFAVPVLLMSYVSRPVHPFYLLLTLPAGYILAARGIGWLFRWRMSIPVLGIAALAMIILFSANTVRYAEETLATPGVDGLSALPLSAGMDMAHTLIPDKLIDDGGIVFADVENWILNSLRGRLFTVDRDVSPETSAYFVDIPKHGGLYLYFNQPNFTYTFADGTGISTLPTDQSNVHIEESAVIRSDVGISYLKGGIFANPVTGKDTNPRQPLIFTYWRIDELPPNRDGWLFGAFVHVYDATGKRVAIASGHVVAGTNWRLGDIYVVMITPDIPADAAEPFTYQVGQYDGVHNLNAIFKLPDGTFSPTISLSP
ncbi:MAG: hypothetical protein KF716_17910 [Anaerolineae bacterium]|nr:hypothetical protein [Anaerolineae bacterium]